MAARSVRERRSNGLCFVAIRLATPPVTVALRCRGFAHCVRDLSLADKDMPVDDLSAQIEGDCPFLDATC